MKKNNVFFAFALSLLMASAFATSDPFSFPVNVAPNKIARGGSAVFDTSKMETMVLYQIRCHVVTQEDQDPIYIASNTTWSKLVVNDLKIDNISSQYPSIVIPTKGQHILLFDYFQSVQFNKGIDNPLVNFYNGSSDPIVIAPTCEATPIV